MPNRPTYDSAVIYDFAGRLLAQADRILAGYTVVGALIGACIGYVLLRGGLFVAIAAVLVGLIGYMAGTNAALRLRLQAQTALCQVAIEENTRRPR